MSSSRVIHKIHSLGVRAALRLWYGPQPTREDYVSPILSDQDGNDIIKGLILSDNPCMVTRLGGIEGAIVTYYDRWRRRFRLPYPKKSLEVLRNNAGVFPATNTTADYMCERYRKALGDVDLMGCSIYRGEQTLFHRYCPDAKLTGIEAVNPLTYARPWTSALKGKRVLVIHPFAASIQSQYAHNRQKLFANPEMLPEFDLQVIPAVQSIAGETGGHKSWKSALEFMENQISQIDFDIALIGAGAYGLPLAATVKNMGLQAVHLGGATQLLFGIVGRRWELEYSDTIAPLINEFWVRPSSIEIPAAAKTVENGCYW